MYTVQGGWYPRFSPSGRRACFGFGRGVGWIDLEAGKHYWVVSDGLQCGFRTESEIVFQREPKTGRAGMWVYDVDALALKERQISTLIGSNQDAADGHWALNQVGTGRLYYDGNLVSTKGYMLQCRVAGPHLVSRRLVSRDPVTKKEEWVIDHFIDGKFHRTIDPPGQQHELRVSREGWISAGYFGPVRVTSPQGTLIDASVANEGGESPGAIERVDDELWILTGGEIRNTTFMALRPIGDIAVTMIRHPAVRPALHIESRDTALVAGESTTGNLLIARVSLVTPRERISIPYVPPPIEPIVSIGREQYVAFYTFGSSFGDLPANSDVRITWGDEIVEQPFLKVGDKKIATYVEGKPDGSVQSLEKRAIDAKTKYRLPTLGYWTFDAQKVRVPRSVDWVAVEGYPDKSETPAQFEVRLRNAIRRCKVAFIVCKAYSSNTDQWSDLRTAIPIYARVARDLKNVMGLLVFSAGGRGTGWDEHPEIHSLWKELFEGVTGVPQQKEPQEPDTPPAPKPPEEVPVQSIALRTHFNKYVCAELNNTLGWRDKQGPWETFTVVPSNFAGWKALKTAHGRFVCAEPNGERPVHMDRLAPNEWESFKIVPGEGGGIGFRTMDGHFLCAELHSDERMELHSRRTELHAWETFNGPITTGQEPGPTPPIQPPGTNLRPGLVRGSGFSFVDDAGPFLGWGQSLFWAVYGSLHEPERVDAHCSFIGGEGSDFIRVMCTGLRKGAIERSVSPRDPRFQEAIVNTLLKGQKYGLRTMLTIFGAIYDAPTEAERVRAAELVCEAVKPYQSLVWMIEIANEGSSNGFPGEKGARELKKLADLVASKLSVLVATTGLHGKDDIHKADVELYYKDCKASAQTHHYSRLIKAPDGVWRPTKKPWREMLFQVDGCAKLVQNGEPRGAESSGSETNDPLVIAMDAAVTWECGVGSYVQHCGAGIYGLADPRGGSPGDDRPRDLWETDRIKEACAGIRNARAKLPNTLPNWNKHQADSSRNPFTFKDVPEEQFTCAYAASRDKDVVLIPCGVVKDTEWRLRAGGSGTVYNPVSNTTRSFTNSFTMTRHERAGIVVARTT